MIDSPVPEPWIESANYVRRQLGSLIGMWNAVVTGDPVAITLIGEHDRPIVTLPASAPILVTSEKITWIATLQPGILKQAERAYGLVYGTATNKRRIRWTSYGVPAPMTVPVDARWTLSVTCSADFIVSLDAIYEFEEDGVLKQILVRNTSSEPGEPVYG